MDRSSLRPALSGSVRLCPAVYGQLRPIRAPALSARGGIPEVITRSL